MAEVKYVRKSTDIELNDVEIEDGQLLFTGEGHTFVDFGSNRIPMQNTPDSSMNSASTNTVQNKVIKSYVDNEVATINDKNYKKIIWNNNDPSTSFGAGTINLNESLNNYDMYEIIFRQSTVNARHFTTGKVPVGYGTICEYLSYVRPTSEIVSGNSITFEDAKNSGVTDNTRAIPLYVIGHKTGLFS